MENLKHLFIEKTFGGNIPNVNRAGFSVTKMHQWSFYSSICSVFSIPYLGAKKPSFFKCFFFHNYRVIRYKILNHYAVYLELTQYCRLIYSN